MATVMVVGATGMTGQSLVEQLLRLNHAVRVVVRSVDKLSPKMLADPKMTIVEAGILDLSDEQMASQVRGCDAVVSCLGHVMDFNGMFGEPRQLCTEATRRLCQAIESANSSTMVKFILMSSVGVTDPALRETRSQLERGVLFLLRHLLPPHRDNETAAGYLSLSLGRQNQYIEWCCVRPDSLIDAGLSPYEVQASPSTGIFTGRPTTRANVARFMTQLIEDETLWLQWRFRMPVIMNAQAMDDTSM